MEEFAKRGTGTVTSLAEMFPAEDAQKAVKRVQEKLAEIQNELHRVRGFISDNSNLINLVQKLPEQLHHNIIVNTLLLPFLLFFFHQWLIFLKLCPYLCICIGSVWKSCVFSGAFDTHE